MKFSPIDGVSISLLFSVSSLAVAGGETDSTEALSKGPNATESASSSQVSDMKAQSAPEPEREPDPRIPADETSFSKASSSESATYGARSKLVLEEPAYHEDPKNYSFSLTAGNTWFNSGDIATTFEPLTPSLRVQFARQIFNQVQFQAELHRVKDEGFNLGTVSGEVSGDTTYLRVLTGDLSVAYRFDYFYEQTFVPFVSAGISGARIDLETGEEESDETTTDEEASSTDTEYEHEIGHRLGYHFGGGLEFLLDTFEPTRAADLEFTSGINDCYLVFDVRYSKMRWYLSDKKLEEDVTVEDSTEDDKDIWLDGIQFTLGFKFDF